MRSGLVLFFISFIAQQAFAQLGGTSTYNFLKLSPSARITALGGNQIAVKDNDAFLGYVNPSLLNDEMDNFLSLTYTDYMADINVGFASFTKHFDSIGTFNAAVKYIDYGDFDQTDLSGVNIGSFTAGEYAYTIGYGRAIDSNYSVGVNVNAIYSSLYDYQSLGLSADAGITYYSAKRRLSLALLAKNMGGQLSTYVEERESEKLPFELQLGFSKRLKRVPVRIGVIARNLQQWDLMYDNPDEVTEEVSLFDNQDAEERDRERETGFFYNTLRHLLFNLEFLVTENVNIRVGYDYFHRRELRIDEKLGTVGLSWGFGIKVSKFHISYGRMAFHEVGATNTFSVSTRLSDFIN
jgi:hypothetical protein